MDYFYYRNTTLYCEQLRLHDIVAESGTPVYVYSQAAITSQWQRLQQAFASLQPLICYAVKANSNLILLRYLKKLGAGFDVVSGGELFRVLTIEADPATICFAGVGKTAQEIRAGLREQILMFNVESLSELSQINELAISTGRRARVCLRVNPQVNPRTHPYLVTGSTHAKFGIMITDIKHALNAWCYPAVELVGFHMHIGSQISAGEPYQYAVEQLQTLVAYARAQGFPVQWINIGGGFGINYHEEDPLPMEELARLLEPQLSSCGCRLIMEPGRYIVGNAGVLITRVLHIKESAGHYFIICDAGMNDLMRPSLYQAYHRILPLDQPQRACRFCEVVGPVCESGDYFAKKRPLPNIGQGELLAIAGAGAYGFTMSSQYNSRPRAPEILVSGQHQRLIRRRENYTDLIRAELEPLENDNSA